MTYLKALAGTFVGCVMALCAYGAVHLFIQFVPFGGLIVTGLAIFALFCLCHSFLSEQP